MSSLPDEIIEDNILTRLPVKSISRFRCVSKTWRLLFRNPNFIKNHLNHAIRMNNFNILVANDGETDNIPSENYLYFIDNNVVSSTTSSQLVGHALKIDYPFMSQKRALQLIGSCDGLVCIVDSYRSICIWNPATREYKTVPKTTLKYPSADLHNRELIALGFGFDCKNNDYKVLRVVGFDGSEISEARVYSLKSNSWKELGFTPYDFSFGKNEGFLYNGALYWVRRNGLSTAIVCYKISDESFHHLPFPKKNSIDYPFMSDLGIWEGKLCLLRRNHMKNPRICTHENDYVDVWTMMDNKWSKNLKITAQLTDMYYGRPIQTLQNGDILLEGGPREEEGDGFISYDHKLGRARAMKIHGFPEYFEVQIYIETLVPLNSGTFVGHNKIELQGNNTRKRRNGL